ncbi:phosphomannomutase [Candidatus Peregrinibacteria bacterium CG10_big_fil_rev_8_21_14_0_10_49_10]|nr:MAG: phosphomannomutase [Candidatus Peregrinibacteria bacterium CG10_big_fil_rev_8_21_14_0_10_49_10]
MDIITYFYDYFHNMRCRTNGPSEPHPFAGEAKEDTKITLHQGSTCIHGNNCYARPEMTPLNPHIFRAYDIRGTAGEQLTEETYRLIGRGFGSVLRELSKKEHPTVVLGRDARTHSPDFEKAMMEGLCSTGCTVLHIGQTPSPLNYFTICTKGLDGGVQITASHNPAEDNGIKLQIRDAHAYAGEDIQNLRRRIEKEQFVDGEGSGEEWDAISPYFAFLEELFGSFAQNMPVAIDTGNGVAGPVYAQALRHAGCEVHELYTEPDGTFPNHAADPSKRETLKDLQHTVTEKKCALGVAFDGDGDRLGLVDEQGTIRTADEVLLLLAQDHLSRHKGKPVVCTVSSSGALQTEIRRWGGVPVMCKVGHSFVEHAMQEHGALLGGEQSGHFFCGEEYFGFDDALVAALRVLKIVHAAGKPVSKLCADFPTVYQTPEQRPFCPDEEKTRVIGEITEHFAKKYPVKTMDGARIDFGDGAWAGIRQSNTSPCISICLEARSPGKLAEIERVVTEEIQKHPEVNIRGRT